MTCRFIDEFGRTFVPRDFNTIEGFCHCCPTRRDVLLATARIAEGHAEDRERERAIWYCNGPVRVDPSRLKASFHGSVSSDSHDPCDELILVFILASKKKKRKEKNKKKKMKLQTRCSFLSALSFSFSFLLNLIHRYFLISKEYIM